MHCTHFTLISVKVPSYSPLLQMSKAVIKGWESNSTTQQLTHLLPTSSSISSSAKSFADIMSEDLIASIMKEESPIKTAGAGGGGDGYVTGALSQEQKCVVDSLAELLMDDNKAFAEAALRRQRFDFERAADFYFQNQESFDAFVLEDVSLSFATTTILDSDSDKVSTVTATEAKSAREEKDSVIATHSLRIDAVSNSNSYSNSNSNSDTSSSGDNGAALKALDDTLSDENVAAISDECIAALLQELYDKDSYNNGDDDDNDDDCDYDDEDTEGSSNTTTTRNHPSYHQSNTFRDAIELKNDLLHFYGGYSGGNPQALHPLMDESTSSAFGVRDYSLKNSEKDLPLFKGKVTVTHAAEFVSKHDPLLQGLQNSKSLSGMYGVGDLIGSQILVKNTEANAIKVFSNKLDSAHNNRKPRKNRR